jgi:DNA processing protein
MIQMKSKLIITEVTPYLSMLKELAVCPRSLYVSGELPRERKVSVAIVGTRRPTPYGKDVTYRLAYDLAKRGVVIISGLAIGVDAVAHRAALEAGGVTIAVQANGLDRIYPSVNRGLAEKIIERGAVVSEYDPGVSARKHQFLARNRLVSGLADAVIVTEAAARSGTLSTVNHALDQNKEVFAVPGNITSLLSVGPNRLIQQGAHPALSADDVLEIIAPHLLKQQTSLALGTTPEETTILKLLQSGVRDGNELQRLSGVEASEFSQALSMLEIQGVICGVGANRWALR